MAWTEAVAGFTGFRLLIQRGDTRQEQVVKDIPAIAFQATFADGLDQQKAIRIGALASVLGCRGDKLHILSTHTGKVDLDEADAINALAMELADIQNVPQNVQLNLFGKISPFVSPAGIITKNALAGISAERKLVGNGAIGSATTINMLGDSRFVMNDDDSATANFDINSPLVTLTPNASDVLVVKPAYIINIDIDTFGS
ncbi:hypothetical protein ES702_07286 [subsurface metagenome]